jgi:MarR family transcriptional regulator, organic hydroperoxide resistance regulator
VSSFNFKKRTLLKSRNVKISDMEINEFLPYLLAHASRLISKQIDEIAAAEGLSRNECKILITLSKIEGVTLNELAGLMIIKQPTLSRIVDAMVKAGWLFRDVVKEDRRSVNIRLTNAGRDQAAPLLSHAREMDNFIAKNIGSIKSKHLKKLLRTLILREKNIF